jgi:hypothetical protein
LKRSSSRSNSAGTAVTEVINGRFLLVDADDLETATLGKGTRITFPA